MCCLVLQAKDSLVCKQYGRLLRTAPQDDLFYQRLRSSSDVRMALMVRASRNLPIKLLAGEYEKILRRRLAVVGGSPDDSALAEMVSKFRYVVLLCDSSSVCSAVLSALMCMQRASLEELKRNYISRARSRSRTPCTMQPLAAQLQWYCPSGGRALTELPCTGKTSCLRASSLGSL